jgi:hypothetical protein
MDIVITHIVFLNGIIKLRELFENKALKRGETSGRPEKTAY